MICPLVHDDHTVHVDHGGEAMGDDQDRWMLRQGSAGLFLMRDSPFRIDAARGLVEDQDLRDLRSTARATATRWR